MLTARILERFDDHHGKAIAIFAQMRPLLAVNADPDLPALARIRWELLRILVEFQMFKHQDIFDPVIRLGTPQQRDQAQSLKDECAALGLDVRQFVATWSNGSVGTAWPEYRIAAASIIGRAERGLIGQRRAIVTLLTKPTAIIMPPRASPGHYPAMRG